MTLATRIAGLLEITGGMFWVLFAVGVIVGGYYAARDAFARHQARRRLRARWARLVQQQLDAERRPR